MIMEVDLIEETQDLAVVYKTNVSFYVGYGDVLYEDQ